MIPALVTVAWLALALLAGSAIGKRLAKADQAQNTVPADPRDSDDDLWLAASIGADGLPDWANATLVGKPTTPDCGGRR